MNVSTERITELRDRFKRSVGTGLTNISHMPQEVANTSRDLVAVMNEVLEYREAEEESMTIPLEGTVR